MPWLSVMVKYFPIREHKTTFKQLSANFTNNMPNFFYVLIHMDEYLMDVMDFIR